MEFKTDALLLRAVDYGENDRMATLLTAGRGKLGAGLKGVKKAGARLRFAAQPFCFAEYVLAEKSGRYTVISASLYDGFFSLREDVGRFYAASVVTEACDKLTIEGMPCGELLVAAVSALRELSDGEPALPLIKFLLDALRIAGYPIRADAHLPSSERAVNRTLHPSESAVNRTLHPSEGVVNQTPPPSESTVNRTLHPSEGVVNQTPPPSEGGRGVGGFFFNMEQGTFSSEKGTPASRVTYQTLRHVMGDPFAGSEEDLRDGCKRALRLLYSYFAYQTDSELTTLPEFIRML